MQPMRAIFLDRDGVINENRADHVKCWDEFSFLPGALSALRWLHLAGFHVFVVTNQAIVSRRIVTAQTIEEINARMALQVILHGGHISDIRYCPHDSDQGCECRKPSPGMLLDLAAHWHVDLHHAYLVGDAWTDIAAGRTVNSRCILVQTGRGNDQALLPQARQFPADHVAADLASAVSWIFAQEGLTPPAHDHLAWVMRPERIPWETAISVAG
jgi:D-glycero-D-manno-heptose 1,7-bisphosphate phosphatase